jgi:hypothetical protein
MIAEIHSFFIGLATVCGILLVSLVISIFWHREPSDDDEPYLPQRRRPSDDEDLYP